MFTSDHLQAKKLSRKETLRGLEKCEMFEIDCLKSAKKGNFAGKDFHEFGFCLSNCVTSQMFLHSLMILPNLPYFDCYC